MTTPTKAARAAAEEICKFAGYETDEEGAREEIAAIIARHTRDGELREALWTLDNAVECLPNDSELFLTYGKGEEEYSIGDRICRAISDARVLLAALDAPLWLAFGWLAIPFLEALR